MNKVILLGNLTRDPEIRYTQSAEPLAIAKFTLAVSRRFKREGEPDADFILCRCFGKQAEFVERYFKKGMKMALTGRITVYTYDDQAGQKRWMTEVIAEELEFAESRSAYEARMAQGGGDAGFAGGQPDRYDAQDRYGEPNRPASADRYGSSNRGASDYNASNRSASNTPAAAQANYEPEGFSAITESIDDDDLPF